MCESDYEHYRETACIHRILNNITEGTHFKPVLFLDNIYNKGPSTCQFERIPNPDECYQIRIPRIGIWINSKSKIKVEKHLLHGASEENAVQNYEYLKGLNLIRNQKTFYQTGICTFPFHTGKLRFSSKIFTS